ncbi:MAG TPA: bifunctional 4-hydroxy-2-oxoglutarate aldolase/2-dehydro-3-deoxy-phosphogluconate aldolase [candidate division Zixibacteria bacterium]|nr:bifunctional 4-hydroxy-2-oxoglutarate aldolase/2-dehydro-3-deoxy-phosphogluconate aldolase [candidate division Zixibacteria bacterium]
MERGEIVREMERRRLVAVVRSRTSEDALAIARAVAESGVKFIEITSSVPGALDIIRTLARQGQLRVGAGTVLTKEQARQALEAGAEFIVAPTLELELVPVCHEAGAACIPGAATPTEALAAHRAGADLVKIFPADCVGGPLFLRQMAGPFPEMRFMVSGGVGLDNVKDYVQAGATGICLGSAYLAATLAQKRHGGLVNELQHFVKLVDEAQRS